MLDKITITKGRYSLGINKSSFKEQINFLETFLLENDSKFIDELINKLWIIEKDNILRVFKRFEEEKNIELSIFDKEDYIKLFEINRKMILSVLEKVKKIKERELKKVI